MLNSLLRILALTRKELLAVLKDPRSRVTLFLPPILQSLLFGYAATYDLSHVPYAIFDQDRSAAASLLAMPGRPVQEHSARSCPGAAGCAVQVRLTLVPSTPEIAHSACGTTAGGHE